MKKRVSLKRKIIRLLGLPDWEGYYKSREEWYERERAFGMTLEEEAEFRAKDERIIKHLRR